MQLYSCNKLQLCDCMVVVTLLWFVATHCDLLWFLQSVAVISKTQHFHHKIFLIQFCYVLLFVQEKCSFLFCGNTQNLYFFCVKKGFSEFLCIIWVLKLLVSFKGKKKTKKNHFWVFWVYVNILFSQKLAKNNKIRNSQ